MPRREGTSRSAYCRDVSERSLEIARQPDGAFLATFDDRDEPVPVTTWAEIRRLRARHRQEDHWASGDRDLFIAQHGHPFDDWWTSLGTACRDALLADPSGAVPSAYAEEIRRSLRSEPGRDGLRVDGSYFTVEVREFLSQRSAMSPTADGAH